ncbi:MAG TPA: helix-turn-helix transcriptional regulator [Terrimicrobiaceae bacterium]|nr:helix-turn-helix transcriptional regulator [Terrimicrobiaceae bacterium]
MTFPAPSLPEADEAEVLRRSRRLGDPVNYWSGEPGVPPVLPTNILLFPRFRAAAFRASERTPWQHHRFILITALRGGGLIGLDAHVHRLRERQTQLIFPFQSHCFFQITQPAIHWVIISFEMPAEQSMASLRNRPARNIGPDGLRHLRDILRSWQSPESRAAVPLHLAIWLREMQQRPPRVRTVRADTEPPGADATFVAKANAAILAHRAKPLPIAALSRLLGCSPSSARSRFRAYTGQSLGRHIRGIKISHACKLLAQTRLPVGEIAERCGYESLFAFSRAFRAAMGCPPTAYRRNPRRAPGA